MTAEECNGAFEQLAGFLREIRCAWIVSEVEETLNLGRIHRGYAEDYSDDAEEQGAQGDFLRPTAPGGFFDFAEENLAQSPTPRRRKKGQKGRPVEIQQVQQFSPKERLQILLTAIKRAFVSTVEMESAIASTLLNTDPKIQSVIVQDEGLETRVHTDLLRASVRGARVQPLSAALDRLRTMAE
jgi:hypothetical protein